jgi:hypothetical protein
MLITIIFLIRNNITAIINVAVDAHAKINNKNMKLYKHNFTDHYNCDI